MAPFLNTSAARIYSARLPCHSTPREKSSPFFSLRTDPIRLASVGPQGPSSRFAIVLNWFNHAVDWAEWMAVHRFASRVVLPSIFLSPRSLFHSGCKKRNSFLWIFLTTANKTIEQIKPPKTIEIIKRRKIFRGFTFFVRIFILRLSLSAQSEQYNTTILFFFNVPRLFRAVPDFERR